MHDLHAALHAWHREAAKQHPVTRVWPKRVVNGVTFPEERREVTLPKARIMVAHRVLGSMSPAELEQSLALFDESTEGKELGENDSRDELGRLWILRELEMSPVLEHIGEGDFALEMVKDAHATPAKIAAYKKAFLAPADAS